MGELMRPRLLVVDDEEGARSVAGRILEPHYETDFAADAHEARGKLISGLVHLLLCDINLPGESGMQLVESLLAKEDDLAVVMVTGEDNPELADRAFEMGAYGYLVKPFRRGDLLITVGNALRRRQLEQRARAHEQDLTRDVIAKGLEAERMRMKLKRSERSLERSRIETVHRLSLAVEMRDQVTADHVVRMGDYCEKLWRRLDLDEEMCDLIAPAATMHDIGKIGIPDSILLKKGGPLTREERSQMQRHAELGREILQGSESPILQLAESIAWTHHEKFDGSGYPRGLRGKEIPIEGRVAAIADVFDAITRDRPYRQAMSVPDAVALMTAGRGTHFDAGMLDSFMSELPAAVTA
jgi:putative two-component system response regulator